MIQGDWWRGKIFATVTENYERDLHEHKYRTGSYKKLSITSWRESFSSASSGARMASIGGMSSSFWAACTLRKVASAANWAANADFFSSFIFLTSRFCKYFGDLLTTINHQRKQAKGKEKLRYFAFQERFCQLEFLSHLLQFICKLPSKYNCIRNKRELSAPKFLFVTNQNTYSQ